MAEATAVKKPRAPRAAKAPTEEAIQATPKASPKAQKAPTADKKSGFAVISTGGKQYLVTPGQKLKIEKVIGDHKEGDVYVFRDVLLTGEGSDVKLGSPLVSGASVHATITKISRYKTVDVIKYKQKSRYFKKYGHRQPYFEVKIDSIN